MKEFMEKWKNDPKFKNKVELIFYSIFIVLVTIFAAVTKDPATTNTKEIETNKNDININDTETLLIEIPEQYKYTQNIKINEKNYQYTGTKDKEKETITKVSNEETTNYIYQDDKYFKIEEGSYILTTKEIVYDIVDPSYLDLETINLYLSKSNNKNNQYLVYLKDIILGNSSEEYITISIDKNKIHIDYTSLMKLFDETVEKYLIEVIIEEIE